MTNTDFHARRTELSNTFAAAGAELLDYMRCAGALAAIPNTQQFVVAGDIAAIRAQLDTVAPQRRMRHGYRPEQPLYFGPEAGQARRWAALITSTGHGVLQEYGTAFEHAQPGQEVLEVMEILPGAPATANKAAEEGELPVLPEPAIDGTKYHEELKICYTGPIHYTADQMREYARQAIAADRASRQGSSVPDCFANKAEVELSELKRFDFEVEDGQRYICGNPDGSWVRFADVEALIEAAPPATTGASTAPLNLDAYDAGSLSDFGGGDVNWWQDYIRAELDRAHDFYQSQIEGSAPASTVLTDERQAFEVMVRTWDIPSDALERLPDGRYVQEQIEQCWSGWESRSKVAAQAGQVAVPEAAIWDAITRLERSDSTQQERFAAADGLRAIAAPSPAKESK